MRILYSPSNLSQQRQFEKKNVCIYPILMAMECEKRRQEGHEVYWAQDGGNYNFLFDYGDHKVLPYDKVITEPEGLPFLSLPSPDRIFTRAMDKKYQQNGNFKYLPGTYIMSASGCLHGACSFCVERGKPYEVRPVDSVIEEIKECKQMGYREIFDDSATLPTGRWLDEFIKSKRGVDIKFSCNMRLVDLDYSALKNVGFRMILVGLESANESTLERINKGIKTTDIKYIIKAAEAGLAPHGAFIFGFPWETDEDAIRTLRLAHYLLKKGYLKTAQASFYDVKEVKGQELSRKYIKQIYDVAYSPQFWFSQLKDIHNVDDLKYLWRAIKKGVMR